ncbi:MAG: alpha-galactosidase [Planctomycetes bacterium]|nr:alpha-galactosidase [Planctomycetota bacterium]
MTAFLATLRAATGSAQLTASFHLRTTVREEEGVASAMPAGGGAGLRVAYPCGVVEEHLLEPGADGTLRWRRRLASRASHRVRLVETALRLDGIDLGGERAGDWFYHTENPRIYGRMTIPVAAVRDASALGDSGFDQVAGNRWCDPGTVHERIGVSPYQPFPGLLLGNRAHDRGLAFGPLAQEVFCTGHVLTHVAGRLRWSVLSTCKAVGARVLAPGEALPEDVWHLGRVPTTGIGEAFAGYVAALRTALGPALRRSVNRHAATWGSWNAGVFRDIDQDRLLRQAAVLRRHLPTVAWLQVDDGWAAGAQSMQVAHGIGAAWEPGDGVDRRLFPDGLDGFCAQVRAQGLEPALWIGLWVPAEAPLVRDRPDWFLDYSYRVPKRRILDISRADVREYLVRALDRLVAAPGLGGVKLDFWSYVFEDRHDLLEGEERTGGEWRAWWFGELRRRLPAAAFVQTGCDIGMGDPFLGRWIDNYRYGIDIGSGEWEHMRICLQWGAACIATRSGDLSVPNSDAVCLFEHLSENEMLCWTTFCLISRTLCEVGGWLDGKEAHPRFRWLRKSLACLDNGGEVRFARYDFRAGDEPPLVWWLPGPWFSRDRAAEGLAVRTVALFNLGEAPARRGVSMADLGLPAGDWLATAVWSGETVPATELESVEVPAHGARLYTIAAAGAQAVLDADHEVVAARRLAGGGLAVDLRHAGPLELRLARRPQAVAQDGAIAGLEVVEGQGNWILRGECRGDAHVELT